MIVSGAHQQSIQNMYTILIVSSTEKYPPKNRQYSELAGRIGNPPFPQKTLLIKVY
jgi:hypothetical protein